MAREGRGDEGSSSGPAVAAAGSDSRIGFGFCVLGLCMCHVARAL